MAKQIFYVQSCNEWKEYSSMRLLFIGTSIQKLVKFVAKQIEDEEMSYDDGNDSLISKQQAKLFKKDFKMQTLSVVNSRLRYGLIDYTHDNEEI